jgi:hypothetical protein
MKCAKTSFPLDGPVRIRPRDAVDGKRIVGVLEGSVEIQKGFRVWVTIMRAKSDIVLAFHIYHASFAKDHDATKEEKRKEVNDQGNGERFRPDLMVTETDDDDPRGWDWYAFFVDIDDNSLQIDRNTFST